MKTNSYRFTRPPADIGHSNVRLDNLAIVPASLLPFKDQWREIANTLPAGGVLIILPSSNVAPGKALCVVAASLQARGHRVTILAAQQFVQP